MSGFSQVSVRAMISGFLENCERNTWKIVKFAGRLRMLMCNIVKDSAKGGKELYSSNEHKEHVVQVNWERGWDKLRSNKGPVIKSSEE